MARNWDPVVAASAVVAASVVACTQRCRGSQCIEARGTARGGGGHTRELVAWHGEPGVTQVRGAYRELITP